MILRNCVRGFRQSLRLHEAIKLLFDLWNREKGESFDVFLSLMNVQGVASALALSRCFMF